MSSRALMRWLRIVGSTTIVVALPMLVAEYVLSHHAMSLGRAELRHMATAYVEQADRIVGEGLTVLKRLKTDGRTGCSLEDRQAYGTVAFNSDFVQQVGVADNRGILLCGEPMGALASPVRLPSTTASDPSIMLGVLGSATGEPQAVVSLRVDGERRLVARFSRQSIAIASGSPTFRRVSSVTVYLQDGSQWWHDSAAFGTPATADMIVERARSAELPLQVLVSAPPDAARELVAPLRRIAMVAAIFTGAFTLLTGIWLTWHKDEDQDEFTRAVRAQEFVPYYQPVMDLFTGELRGCELLVRWRRADGSMVPPGAFLPYAEATGAIREITRQLMAQSVDDLAELYAVNPQLKLSVNLTASHFDTSAILDEIRDIYDESGIAFSQLVFEVTEQHPLRDLDLARKIVGHMQALGAAVALDDAGTGHGVLTYLQKLGVDVLKIDKMFIDGIGIDVPSEKIIRSLVDLGHELGLGIIAEGVERQDQAEYLKGIGVAVCQGYLFSPALPAKAYIEYAAANKAAMASAAAAEPLGAAA